MAGIEFKVDAVLGDVSKLQQQINNLKMKVALDIDTTQSLKSIDNVKSRINKMYDGIKSSDIAKRLGLQEFDSLDQRVQQLANDMKKITSQTITTDGMGNVTCAAIQYKD